MRHAWMATKANDLYEEEPLREIRKRRRQRQDGEAAEPSGGSQNYKEGSLEVTQAEQSSPKSAAAGGIQKERPCMVDVMEERNSPLAKGFEMAGWNVVAVERAIEEDFDFFEIGEQAKIKEQLKQADFVWATLDGSSRSRSGEASRQRASSRAKRDNAKAEFILGELELHQSRGGTSGRESRVSSQHWATPKEVAMFKQGTWWDKCYDACSLQGARRKRQCIRHDVEEIRLWPDMYCRHGHHLQEWMPQESEGGGVWYPDREEMEYTACLVFHIVYSVSVWACRVGRAKVAVPRCPPVECTGDKREWLAIDARAFRDWAMIPMAIAVGLDVGKVTRGRSEGIVPSRHRMASGTKQELAVDEVYIGHGHHSHRQRASKWASQFIVGQHGTVEECLILYADHISSSELAGELEELAGKKLYSDTPEEMPCTADVLIAMVYCAWADGLIRSPREHAKRRKRVTLTSYKWSRKALGLMAATAGDLWRAIGSEERGIARQPPLPLQSTKRWQQQVVTETFASYFPEEVFRGFAFPYIEDVVNLPAFNRYAEWVEGRGIPPGRPRPPCQVEKIAARAARGAEGVQLRAFNHKAALPPLVSFGLAPDRHFEEALRIMEGTLPAERSVIMDEDLKFAAAMMARNQGDTRQLREEAIRAVKLLKHRWRSVTSRLRKIQQEGIKQVTIGRDIGLLTLLSIVMLWPDHTFGEHLVYGFPGVGHCEWSGIFPRREVTPSEREDPFKGAAEHNKNLLLAMHPGKDDAVILEKSMVDAQRGFATQPMSHEELIKHLGGKEFRLIRRFVITQATGKQRIIDDAAAGGQSEVSTDENVLGFCNALQPASHLAALVSALAGEGIPWPRGEQVQSGGEDWPDAYRYTPMRPEESRACVVVWWHPEKGMPVFQRYHGLLFGLPNAVTSFNRWSKFAQALVRRLLMTLFSMYFDDATMQDWESEAAHSQACIAALMQILGSPWAILKSQACSYVGDFLGLMHDVSRAEEGIIRFWPRESLVTKVLNIISMAREAGLAAGTASKLYGVANFIETGMYARVGRAGLWAIKDRQKETIVEITPPIRLSFELLEDLFKLRPRREYLLWSGIQRRVVTASDAAYEGGKGSAGFLCVVDPGQPEETRLGRVITIPKCLYSIWGEQITYIAQLELVAVLVAITEVAREIRGANSVWFIDNVAALMALVRGSSRSHSLDQMAKIIHLACFAVRSVPYFEYVESEANWADEISRVGTQGNWAPRNAFVVDRCGVATELLTLPSRAIVKVFEFL